MRFLVFGSTALAIILALLLFEDMDVALPVVGLMVWAAVAIAGLVLALRMRGRSRRAHRPRRPRRARLLTRIAPRRAEKPLLLPRR